MPYDFMYMLNLKVKQINKTETDSYRETDSCQREGGVEEWMKKVKGITR